jgi:spore germination protein KC
MKMKWLSAVLPLIFLMSLCGCGFKDIDKRFFVVAMAVDPSENADKLYHVTLKLAIPSPSEKFGSNEFTLVSEDTGTIAEAVRLIKSKVDKELDFGHLKVILLGQALVQKGNVGELMDWFIRRRDIQFIAWVAVGAPTGQKILELKPKTERLPANMLIMSFGQVGTETAYIVSEYMFDFRRRLTERGLDPILPIVEPRGNQQVEINRVAVLNKEKQMTVLNPLETKIFNSLYQGIGKYDIRVEQDSQPFIISADNVKGTFTIQSKDGRPHIRVIMTVHGVIEESAIPLNRLELSKYEQLAEAQIQQRVGQLLKRLQEADLDPVGFGLRYRAQHTGNPDDVWKNWKQLYPQAEFEVQAKVTLFSTGTLG